MNAFRLWRRALVLAVFSLAAIVSPTLAQDSPPTVRVNVIACVDPDCADTVNLVTMEGATVASFDASGAQLDACTVTETPSGMADCAVIPAPEGGWYTTEPTAAYAGHRLVSSEPEVFESEMHGTILAWYYAPEAAPVEPENPQAKVNAIACVDASCENTVDLYTLDGTVFTTYDAAGTEIDSCVVSSEADDFDGCLLVLHPSDGSITIVPPADHAAWELLSMEAEVFESEVHGTTLVWYFVPPKETTPEPTATAPASTVTPVTTLPSTGTGSATNSGLLAAVALTIGVGAAVGSRLRLRTLS